jgi:hypothetical protein
MQMRRQEEGLKRKPPETLQLSDIAVSLARKDTSILFHTFNEGEVGKTPR